MKKLSILICLVLIVSVTKAQKLSSKKDYVITMETSKGPITLILYDGTPLHKANFVKLCKEGIYNGVLFHRVIKDFMIQAGDPSSKNAQAGQRVGMESHGERIPAEFDTKYYHKKGVLAAARDNNPEKKSSGSQFYIVQGKKINADALEQIQRRNNINYTSEQKKVYAEQGGTPFLDGSYTVFGQVIKGIEVVDKIAAVETARADRPKEDVKIISTKVQVWKRKKIAKEFGFSQEVKSSKKKKK